MEQLLAVDGGGAKSEALLMTLDGAAAAFHVVYPEAVSAAGGYGRGRSAQASLAAIRGILPAIEPHAVLHLVVGNGSIPDQVLSELKVSRVMLWHACESHAALAGVGESFGLVALAGTGAYGHLKTPAVEKHADSFGPLLGDWGGAYQIGREGLRAAMRSALNPRRATALREAVIVEMGLTSSHPELGSRLVQEGARLFADRTAVAGYARVVDRAARAGDCVARGILESAAADLAETLEGLVKRSGVENEALPLVGAGGVIRKSDLFWAALCDRVSAFMPRMRPMRGTLPQSAGLALAGLIQAGGGDIGRVRERLMASLPPLVEADERKRGAA
jgi:N-acetylglucosamine kinase-like BadF-type ATPase